MKRGYHSLDLENPDDVSTAIQMKKKESKSALKKRIESIFKSFPNRFRPYNVKAIRKKFGEDSVELKFNCNEYSISFQKMEDGVAFFTHRWMGTVEGHSGEVLKFVEHVIEIPASCTSVVFEPYGRDRSGTM